MKKFLTSVALVALMTTGVSGLAHAQPAPDPAPVPNHAYINHDDQRLENQQDRIDNGVKDGQINAKQEMRDDNRDNRVQQEMTRDEAEHHGHLTNREQAKIHRQLNQDSKHIHNQRHPKPTTGAPVGPAPVVPPVH